MAQQWQRMAPWYDNWVQHNDYVDIVLPWLLDRLEPDARVLEIGPGTGGFTLRLAPAVREIVAVEPASAMRDLLTRRLSAANITNVHVVPRRIEGALDALDGHFDLAFASYSLYDVEAIDAVVTGLSRVAHNVVALMGTGEPTAWRQALCPRFNATDRIAPPQVGPFCRVLLEMGIRADVEILTSSSNYVHDSEEMLVEGWMRRLHLDEERRPELRDALLEVAERRDDKCGIYGSRRMALVSIEGQRATPMSHAEHLIETEPQRVG